MQHRRLSRSEMVILLLYEGVIFLFLLASITPNDQPFGAFLRNPLGLMQVDETSIALALALFLPLLFKQVKSLKLFGAEVELLREVKEEIKQVRRETSHHRYDHERALFVMAASLGRTLEIHPRRKEVTETPIEIGMMDFTESVILALLVYHLLGSHQIPAHEPDRQETTLIAFLNLRSGMTDLLIGYSGTGMMLAGMPVEFHTAESGRERLNDIYRRWGLTWLSPIGFQNREMLVMRRKDAEERRMATVSHLIEQSDHFVFGANREYFLRDWAYPRLDRMGIRFQEIKEVEINDRLTGLLNGEYDVGVIWETDPEIEDSRLKVIEWDDRIPAISQYAMPLCREDVAPQLEPILKKIHISEPQMRKLNRIAQRAGSSFFAIKGVVDDFCRGRL